MASASTRARAPWWRAGWRVWMRRVHLVLGLTAGLILSVSGITGSALVFRNELDAVLHPHLLRAQPGPVRLGLDPVLAAAQTAHPGERPARVQMPRTPAETYEITMAGPDPLQVYVDPYRGTVLGARRESETLPNVLFEIHHTLLAGEAGERVLGITALLLLLVVLTGIVVWWPGWRAGWRRFVRAVSVRMGGSWRAVTFDLHRALGFWTIGFLTVVAVTGASLVFHERFMAGLDWITGSPPRPVAPAVVPVQGARPTVQSMVDRADAAIDGGQVTYVMLPASPTAPLTVRKKTEEELHPSGRNFVYLDPGTGRVLAAEAARTAHAGTRAYNVLYPVHIGRWGGLPSRILHVLLGLTPAILLVSGALMWWNRRGRRLLRQ